MAHFNTNRYDQNKGDAFMKKSVFAIALLVVGILIGCTDNSSLNGPIASGTPNQAATLVKPSTLDSAVPFDAILSIGNDLEVAQLIKVTGELHYSLIAPGRHNILPLETYSMSTSIIASVVSLSNEGFEGSVKAETSEAIEIGSTEPTTCEEAFQVDGLPYSMTLHMKLFVTSEKVTVASIWLTRGPSMQRIAANNK
jgi:hypothetical protein